jgi:hypothetical protein
VNKPGQGHAEVLTMSLGPANPIGTSTGVGTGGVDGPWCRRRAEQAPEGRQVVGPNGSGKTTWFGS